MSRNNFAKVFANYLFVPVGFLYLKTISPKFSRMIYRSGKSSSPPPFCGRFEFNPAALQMRFYSAAFSQFDLQLFSSSPLYTLNIIFIWFFKRVGAAEGAETANRAVVVHFRVSEPNSEAFSLDFAWKNSTGRPHLSAQNNEMGPGVPTYDTGTGRGPSIRRNRPAQKLFVAIAHAAFAMFVERRIRCSATRRVSDRAFISVGRFGRVVADIFFRHGNNVSDDDRRRLFCFFLYTVVRAVIVFIIITIKYIFLYLCVYRLKNERKNGVRRRRRRVLIRETRISPERHPSNIFPAENERKAMEKNRLTKKNVGGLRPERIAFDELTASVR